VVGKDVRYIQIWADLIRSEVNYSIRMRGKKIEFESNKNNSNPSPIQIGFREKLKFDPIFEFNPINF